MYEFKIQYDNNNYNSFTLDSYLFTLISGLDLKQKRIRIQIYSLHLYRECINFFWI